MRFVRLLEAAAATPDAPLHRLELLEAEERRTLLEGFNATAHEVPDATLPALFEAQVERTPDAIAVVFGAEALSYAALNARANQLAHHLIGLGVGPEALVGIALERSVEMVVALVGLLKAGAAYLPLPDDIPAHPYAVAMESAMLAPNAEVSIFPWKEPKERIPLAVRQIHSFLRAHRPG